MMQLSGCRGAGLRLRGAQPFASAGLSSRPLRKLTAPQASGLLDFFKPKPKAVPKPKRETANASDGVHVVSAVIPEPSYTLQAALLGIAGAEAWQGWWPFAVLTGALGVLLTVQATRVQFVFDDEGLEILIKGAESENVVVGGRNFWPYSSFVNWEFWWPAFPVLVYYKETQTKPEGQIHFFPMIFNGKQVYDVMVERCGPSVTSGPKEE